MTFSAELTRLNYRRLKVDFEKLQTASLEAHEAADRENAVLRQLEHTLESEATMLSCGDYMALTARTAQQRERSRLATEKARDLQHQVETLREAESAKLARELAEKALADTEAKLAATQAEIERKRAALSQLQNELPAVQNRASLLMFELNAKREDLRRLSA
jgi:hypothetical protein